MQDKSVCGHFLLHADNSNRDCSWGGKKIDEKTTPRGKIRGTTAEGDVNSTPSGGCVVGLVGKRAPHGFRCLWLVSLGVIYMQYPVLYQLQTIRGLLLLRIVARETHS